jgi:hypothetical protein
MGTRVGGWGGGAVLFFFFCFGKKKKKGAKIAQKTVFSSWRGDERGRG